MCHDESLMITNITSAPARRKVQRIFQEHIPDASESLLKKKNYEDRRSVLLQCAIDEKIVGGLLALHPSTQLDEGLRSVGMTVKDDFPESLATRSIVEVAVLSEYQNMGIGQKLVAQAEKAFVESGATISLLYVDSRSPESTHRFWKKMGYTPGDPNKKGEYCTGLPPEASTMAKLRSNRAGTAYYRYLESPRKLQVAKTPSTQSQPEAITVEVAATPRSWLRQRPLSISLLTAIIVVVSVLFWIL